MHAQAIRWFLVGWALAVVPAVLAVAGLDRFVLHAALNGHHSPVADLVFAHGTHLADTPVPIALALLMLFKDWRAFLLVGLSAGLSAALAQVIKHWVAPDMDRPTLFLEQMPGVELVEGVVQLQHHSFPSGHTTAAYSTGLAFAVLVGRRVPALLFALFAAGIGLSRVYLSQHFTEDVLAGAIIGTFTGLVVYHLLYRAPFSERAWLSRSPFRGQNQ